MDPSFASSDGGDSSVFISSLQWWTTDIDLETLCSQYGQVTGIKFIEDKSCGKSRGMAVVDFANPNSVQACIDNMTGKDINGRPCKVSRQMQRPAAGGFPHQGGFASQGAPPMMHGGGRGRGRGGHHPGMDAPPPHMDPSMMQPQQQGGMPWGMMPPPGGPGMMGGMMPPQQQQQQQQQGGGGGFRPPPPPGAPY